jgi:hypothetical protein
MALAAARSKPNPNRAEAAGGHSQAWPSHHEKATNRRELSFDTEEGQRNFKQSLNYKEQKND